MAAVFMAVHFWRIRKDGGISGPRVESREMKKARDVVKKMQIKRYDLLDPELELENGTNGSGETVTADGKESTTSDAS